MTPIQYCYDKIAVQGSSVYYSLKKIPSQKRDGVVAIAAFYQELMDIVWKSNDEMIASQQLHWWRGEVLRIPQRMAQHPVSLALQNIPSIDIQLVNDVINGVEQTLAFQSFSSFEEVVIHIMRTGGARELLMLDSLGLRNSVSVEAVYQFAMVFELVKYIQSLRVYVRKGLIMFPQDELLKFNVSSDTLQSFKTTPAIKNLLAYQVEKIERAYQQAKETLVVSNDIKYLLARCDIAMATLHEIKNSGFTVLEHFIELTPLRMWWIAYKTR